MEAVVMYHGGVPCVLPAAQALSASHTPPEEAPPVQLWPDGTDGAGLRRFLHVQTARGLRTLPCTEPRTAVVADESVVAMPPLVRGILRMPWVVGLAEVGGDLFWLLDAGAILGGEP